MDEERFEDNKIQAMFGEKILKSSNPSLRIKLFLIDVAFISKLEKLKVKFCSIDRDKAHPVLFEMIYESRLYVLSFENIAHLLRVKYEIITPQEIIHKNYTLIKAQSNSHLAAYVDDSIDDYIGVVLANCEKKIIDDEAIVLAVLNNEDVSAEHKTNYINALQTIIQNLSDVSDTALWLLLLTANLVEHSEKNVLDYFVNAGNQFTNELAQFVDSNDRTYDFSSERKQYDETNQRAFFNSTVQCNELSDVHYEQFLASLGWRYRTSFEIENVTKEKMDILIDNNIICMSEISLTFIRATYPTNLTHFIMANIEDYCDLAMGADVFDLEESTNLLAENIPDVFKLKLLENISDTLTANNSKYSDEVKTYILKNNYSVNDLQHFMLHFMAEGEKTKAVVVVRTLEWVRSGLSEPLQLSKELFDEVVLSGSNVTIEEKAALLSCLLPALDETQCKHYLSQLGLDNFLSLFDMKRPRIAVNTTNERMLEVFLRNGWITKYDVDEKDNNYYRAYGRRIHSDGEKLDVTLL